MKMDSDENIREIRFSDIKTGIKFNADILIKYNIGGEMYEYFYWQDIVDKYPKILAEITNSTWYVKALKPELRTEEHNEYFQIFLMDIIYLYNESIPVDIYVDFESLSYLYGYSVLYNISDLMHHYLSYILKFPLTKKMYRWFKSNNMSYTIYSVCYTNTPIKYIDEKLNSLFGKELWLIIADYNKYRNIVEVWHICWKYVPILYYQEILDMYDFNCLDEEPITNILGSYEYVLIPDEKRIPISLKMTNRLKYIKLRNNLDCPLIIEFLNKYEESIRDRILKSEFLLMRSCINGFITSRNIVYVALNADPLSVEVIAELDDHKQRIIKFAKFCSTFR